MASPHPAEYYTVEALHDYNVDVPNHEIYLMGEESQGDDEGNEPGVEYIMASRFIRNMRFLTTKTPKKNLLIHMKSCGGSWEEGLAIYDTIKFSSAKTTILNYTHARSMTSIIFQAATKRVMMPHSHFMFHGGTTVFSGTYKQALATAEFSRKHEMDWMLDMYVCRMKQGGKFSSWTEAKIKNMLIKEMDKKEDVYLTAEETVEWGLADEIFDGNWGKIKK
jgi:ATP-dependent Clp protease protease subunit